MMYMLGEKYKQQSDLLTMALNIGLEVLKGNGDIEPKEITERADRARCQSSDKRLTPDPCSSGVILYYVTCDVVTEPILLYISSTDSTKMTAMPAA